MRNRISSLRTDAISAHHAEALDSLRRCAAVSAAPLCDHCKEVIGVYEPLVKVTDGQVHEGSRALEPTSSGGEGEHYHRACFERLGEEHRSATG
jgi:hypothetical protein